VTLTCGRSQIILGLDASSTVIGYGALTTSRRFVQAGLITPASRGDSSWNRVMSMGDDLGRLLNDLHPDVVLIEWTKGKVNERRHGGLGAGLAVYGCGVGFAAARALQWSIEHPGSRVEPVLENDWTRGVAKKDRQLAVAALCPEYGARIGDDPGGDMSDGIGLAHWWLTERQARADLFSQGELMA